SPRVGLQAFRPDTSLEGRLPRDRAGRDRGRARRERSGEDDAAVVPRDLDAAVAGTNPFRRRRAAAIEARPEEEALLTSRLPVLPLVPQPAAAHRPRLEPL